MNRRPNPWDVFENAIRLGQAIDRPPSEFQSAEVVFYTLRLVESMCRWY